MAKNARGAGRTVKTGATTEVAGASIARSRGIGALVVAAGAAIMIAGVFLPWLSYSGGRRLSGWKIYQDHANTGGNGFVITRMFTPETRSIFFTGFTILIGAILVIMASLWVLGLARRGRLGRRQLGGHIVFPTMQLATLALGLAIINLVMVLAGDHTQPTHAEPGLFVVVAGGLVLCLGMFAAVGNRRGRAEPRQKAS